MLHQMQFHRLVLIFVTADNEWIYPPAVVDSEAITILHAHGAIGHLLRSRADLSPIPVPDAEHTLADLGHPNPRLQVDHRIASPSLRTALLQLWNL